MSSQTQGSVQFPGCCSTCPRVASLEDRVEELEAENRELRERLCVEGKRYRRLWNRYRRYRNPHTPPSKRLGSNRTRSSKPRTGQGSPGRKKGHKGTTRPRPKPDETVTVTEEVCSGCGARLGEPGETETRVIEDIPEPGPVRATEYRIGHYPVPGLRGGDGSHAPRPPTGGEVGLQRGGADHSLQVPREISAQEDQGPPRRTGRAPTVQRHGVRSYQESQ